MESKQSKRVHIEHEMGYYECGDGCCSDWYDNISVNGKVIAHQPDDAFLYIMAAAVGISETEQAVILNSSDDYYALELEILRRLGYDATATVNDHTSEDMEDAREYRDMMDDYYYGDDNE